MLDPLRRRSPPPLSAVVLAGAMMTAIPAHAQEWRVSVTPFVGRTLSGPVFQHSAREVADSPTPGGGSEPVTYSKVLRLDLRDATIGGVRVEYRVGPGWTAFAEGAYGGTDFDYLDSASAISGGTDPRVSVEVWRRRDDVSSAAFALGLGYQIPFGRPGIELGIGAAGSLQRLALQRNDDYCAPPSTGGGCTEGDPWEERYWLPGAAASLSLRFAVTSSVGVEARSSLTVGRASADSFRESYEPAYGGAEPETSQWVRGLQLSLGLSLRP